MNDIDKFTFEPGDLQEITDPEEIARLDRLTGSHRVPAEEQAYVAEQWALRFDHEKDLSTWKLQEEYREKKKNGEL